MTKLQKLAKLNHWLLEDSPQFQPYMDAFPFTEEGQWSLFRSLLNVRPAGPIHTEFMELHDLVLQEEIKNKGITSIYDLVPVDDGLYLWQGDITALRVDAIVNAANSGMTGCYHPLHACIDNAIHTFSGIQLRQECSEIMEDQGHEEETGKAKITEAYNLPSKHVIHTVGPIIYSQVRQEDCRLLASSYRSSLELADQNNLESIAFCCISTGEFRFPNKIAAEIAIETVKAYKEEKASKMKVVFNVFKDEDYQIYEEILESSAGMPEALSRSHP